MLGPAKIYFILFGLLTIAGGIIGYVSKGSMPSIIAGSVSGLALVAAAFLLPNNAVAGLVLAGLVSILLAGRFVPAFIKTGAIMPAGMMSVSERDRSHHGDRRLDKEVRARAQIPSQDVAVVRDAPVPRRLDRNHLPLGLAGALALASRTHRPIFVASAHS